MTEEEYAQGQRALGLAEWVWAEGMAVTSPGAPGISRVSLVDKTLARRRPLKWFYRGCVLLENPVVWPQEWVPHFGDAATLGCLVGLVRERYGWARNTANVLVPTRVFTSQNIQGWNVVQCWELGPNCTRWHNILPEHAATEVDALLDALAMWKPPAEEAR